MMIDRYDSQGKDRRAFIRTAASFALMFNVKTPFEVRIQLGDKEVDAVTQDIGEGGIAMLTNHEIPTGARINMKFRIFNDSALQEEESHHTFELQGDVRYSRLTKSMDYRLGIQFASISEAERNFLANYVKTNKLRPSQGV